MPTAVIMPKFEMTQETGTVGSWLKAEGDFVRKGDVILEIETDKVTMDVEAPADGTLAGISAGPGQVVPVGQPIAYLLATGETLSAQPSQPASSPAQPASEIKTEADSLHVAPASPLAARMAQDLGVDLSKVAGSGPRGRVTRRDIEAHLHASDLPAQRSQQALNAPTANGDGKVRAVPAARRLARELGIDLTQAQGTGPDARIQSEDVRRLAARSAEIDLAATSGMAAQPPAALPKAAVAGAQPSVRRMIPLTSLRRTIAERMTASVREAPQFTVAVDADMTRALAIVADLKVGATADQPRVTLTVLLIRACAWALAKHPEANSAFVDGQIAEWNEVNVGVATAIDAGLIVPVVHGADRLGMRAIASELSDLATRAREGRLKLEDLQGGTFTLSNLGMFGIDRFTAILNPPQAAILAVGRIVKRPVVADGDRIEIQPLSTLTLTADHRVLDGASAARFLASIQQALEHPGILME